MKHIKTKSYITIENILRLLFIFVVAVSVFSTYHINANILDSDISSEMVMAKHLADTKQWLSTDFVYSTELRAVGMQFILTPLFCIFDNWHTVHFLGASILQLMLVGSYAYMCSQAKISTKSKYLGMIILLLPVSVTYGRIVLYHNFYIMYSILSFLLLGLIIGFYNYQDKSKCMLIIRTVILLFVSLASGLNGTRQLLIFFAPLLVGIICLVFVKDYSSDTSTLFTKNTLSLLVPSFIATFAALIGYLINTKIFSQIYTFDSYSEYALSILPASGFSDLLYGLFHQFGFRENIKMISIVGLLSVAAVFACIYTIVYSTSKALSKNTDYSLPQQLVQSFFIFTFIITTAVFVLSGGLQVYYFPLYYIPVYIWVVPCVVTFIDSKFEKLSLFNPKKIIPVLVVVILAANGLINLMYFHGKAASDQKYDGLTFQNIHVKSDLSGVINHLTENGYDIGYSTFWNANIITELTNGNVKMIGITIDPQTNSLTYYDWLTLLSYRDITSDNAFVLFSTDEKGLGYTYFSDYECVYEDEYYIIFKIDNHADFKTHHILPTKLMQ